MQHFKIVALNKDNEPFNSEYIYDTPKLVNTDEFVYFFYASTTGLSLKGNEKWIWDFDYNNINKDIPVQELTGMTTPLPILFNKAGDRTIDLKVYDSIQKKAIKLESSIEISNIQPLKILQNPYTSNILILNQNSKITILDSLNNSFIKEINLSFSSKDFTYVENNKFYILLNNNTIDVFDTITET